MEQQFEADIATHIPFVRAIAFRVRASSPPHVEMEDLVSDGMIGLVKALRKFDPNAGVRFRSYAQFRVRGAMLDGLRLIGWVPPKADRFPDEDDDDAQYLEYVSQRTPDPRCPLIVHQAIGQLSEHHAHVIRRRYFDDADMSTIASEIGVSNTRIYEVHNTAIAKMRASLVGERKP